MMDWGELPKFRESDIDRLYCERIDLLEKQNAVMKAALQKISDPRKYHHVEPDDYTQVACFMHVANEALNELDSERTE